MAPSSSIAALDLSFSPLDTVKALSRHQWSVYDAQYIFLLLIGIFVLCVVESPGAFVKMGLATLIILSLILPITRQFFLPTLPILGWLFLFWSCKFIPSEYRPGIWVRVLPALENIFYGANLSNILQAHQHWILDVLAWLPYGILHFGAPPVCCAIMFIFAPPKYLPSFARAFGYMNMIGVIIQLFFPCSPPWYENKYGLAAANYSIPGSPAGLARVDELFGLGLYTTTFSASPLVFGAFPSLHSGNATLEALFMANLFPKLTPLFIAYVMWLWWSTMYLAHHYAVDLVVGSILAGICFFITKAKFLPRLQWDKEFRWDYDYIEIGDVPETDCVPSKTGFYEEFHPLSDSDEWTLGTSSSFSSRSRSPSSGTRSSTDNMWESDTLASGSGSDVERGK